MKINRLLSLELMRFVGLRLLSVTVGSWLHFCNLWSPSSTQKCTWVNGFTDGWQFLLLKFQFEECRYIFEWFAKEKMRYQFSENLWNWSIIWSALFILFYIVSVTVMHSFALLRVTAHVYMPTVSQCQQPVCHNDFYLIIAMGTSFLNFKGQ